MLSIEYQYSQGTGKFVKPTLFGTNALHSINTDVNNNHAPTSGFEEAILQNGIENIRFPGGHAENTLDVTYMPRGRLRDEVKNFLDWCVELNASGHEIVVTLVLPTKANVALWQIEKFVYTVIRNYGEIIDAFEIGNEYSIGTEVRQPNRELHPEFIPESDFIPAMNEVEYGIRANQVINSAVRALEQLRNQGHMNHGEPDILLQMAETNGTASNYKGGEDAGNYDLANEAIVAWLDQSALAAIDGVVVHYYYNVSHEGGYSFDDEPEWRQSRRIGERTDNIEYWVDRDLDLHITEWNVLAGNTPQLGAVGASTLVEMFEYIVDFETEAAFIWPLQHRTPNTIFGDRGAEIVNPTMSGAVFGFLSESLQPLPGVVDDQAQFELVESVWRGDSNEVEINHFQSDTRDVLYVSSRSLNNQSINLDLRSLVSSGDSVRVRHLTIDPSSSDGLSDFANAEGGGRVGRRIISQEEYDQLQTLPFFDANNKNHLKEKDGVFSTYLPPFETILPTTADPQSIEDYYFIAEADVRPDIVEYAISYSEAQRIALQFKPFDVVEITIMPASERPPASNESSTGVPDTLDGGSESDNLRGSSKADIINGWLGDDTILSERGNDTITGGYGNDVIRSDDGHDVVQSGSGNDSIFGGSGNDTLHAENGRDSIYGQYGHDFITGGEGNDFVSAGIGDDTIDGGQGADTIFGDAGIDTVTFSSASRSVRVDLLDPNLSYNDALGDVYSDIEVFIAGNMVDQLRGDHDANIFYGGGRTDRLYGRQGNDSLFGERGADAIYGGRGADTMSGGHEDDRTDRFIYFSIDESGVGNGNRDVIIDFRSGEDRIEVSRFDADVTTDLNQEFVFIGQRNLSGNPGELGYRFDRETTIVFVDIDGDATPDFEVELLGQIQLIQQDFVL